MKNLFCTLLLLSLAALRLSALPVTVSGHLTYPDGTAAVEWPVFGQFDPNGNGDVALTDSTGFYSLVIDLPPGDSTVEVQTFDNCGPQFQVVPVVNNTATADFVLCNDPAGFDCMANAFAQIQPGLMVQFSGDGFSFWDSLAVFTYAWDFGDGATSTEQNPVHTYTQAGDYTVVLTVTSSDCTASTSFDLHVEEVQNVTVFGQVTDQNGTGVPFWFVLVETGDPNFPAFANTDQQGNYSVDVSLPLSAAEASAQTFSICMPDLVSGAAPIVNGAAEINLEICYDTFPFPPQCDAYITYSQTGNLTYQFAAYTYAADSTVTFTYQWDFGDGSTSSDPNPTHTYATDGVYNILLTVVSSTGCVAHACEVLCTFGGGTIDTFYYGCQAMFAAGWGGPDPAGNFDPLSLSFFDLSFGVVTNWNWDFGDGATSTEQDPMHTYDEPGLYSVTLHITTVDGCESEITMEVYAGDDFPWTEFDCQAMFLPVPDSTGNGYFFLDLSVANGPVQSWQWNFGDGSSSTEQNPYHSYDQAGVYTVTLSIEADSCNSMVSFELNTDDPFHGFQASGAVLGLASGASRTVDITTLNDLKVYPNPAAAELTLALNSTGAQEVELSLLGLSGQVIRSRQTTLSAGPNAIRIPVQDLTPGLYMAQLRTANGLRTVKFVKE